MTDEGKKFTQATAIWRGERWVTAGELIARAKATTAVYIAHDAEGRCLYVGVARDWVKRLSAHAYNQRNPMLDLGELWLEVVATLKVEWHPSRAEALLREAQLTVELRPRHAKGAFRDEAP